MSNRFALLALVIVTFAYGQVQTPPPPPPPPQNASAPGLPPTSPQNVTAPGLPPSSPQNATAPGLPPTGPSQPSPISTPGPQQPPITITIPGAGQELPPEPVDVPPARPLSACNATRAIVASMNELNVNTTMPLFSRDAVVIADDTKHDFTMQVRGKRRINSFLRANLLFLSLFGPTNFTVIRSQVDQPDRCVAIVMLSSEMLRNCPGASNSSMYAILDVTTQGGLVKSVNRTLDSTQHTLVDECVANKLNQTNGEQFD